jgi:hypothetical protein
MNGTATRFLRIAGSSAGLLVLACVLTSHARPVRHGIPLPTDWSHQHLIFSRPASAEMEPLLAEDPRYLQQAYRRAQGLRLPTESVDGGASSLLSFQVDGLNNNTGGLWSENLGNNASPGPGIFPAKFSFDSTVANCAGTANPDFVVYSTGLSGTATQASIVAFDNLYAGGCTAPVPRVYWAYNTSGASSGKILTSPVMSLDGSQVAFVQTNGAGAGTLVLLKWKASTTETVGAPGTPALAATAALYRTCAAPCIWTIPLISGGTPTDDTTSSVYVSYSDDIGWVGDSGGYLHQFTGIFKGTPAEAGTPWPVLLRPANPHPATSPVFDRVSNKVFVEDTLGGLFSAVANTGVVQVSSRVDFGTGFVESPVVDSASGHIYVFSSSDGSTNCAGGPCSAVDQFHNYFLGGDTGNEVTVGNSKAVGPNPMYIGGFDSAYFSSYPNPEGNLYVCGNTGGAPTLYQIPFINGFLPASGKATVISTVSTAASTAACSPVIDVVNPNLITGSEERLYLSPQNNGRLAACGGKGCLESFIVTPWLPSTNWAQGQEILSPKLHIEVVITAGKSGATPPTWTATNGRTVTDGGVTWIDQGVLAAVTPNKWVKNKGYGLAIRIVDTNNNFEIATTGGTSGGTQPTWPTTPGATIVDNTVTWTNAGAAPTAALPVVGGTTGMIVDNFVTSVTGASQVYFGTLANQTPCVTSGGTGGCAMQASQPKLN